MKRMGLVLALCGTVAACATTQQTTAENRECVDQIEESTGSRVESNRVCRPAEAD